MENRTYRWTIIWHNIGIDNEEISYLGETYDTKDDAYKAAKKEMRLNRFYMPYLNFQIVKHYRAWTEE